MDAIKKQRKTLRSAFTRAYNAFETVAETCTKEDKLIAFQLLEARMSEVNTVHAEYFKLSFTSDATEEQIDRDLEIEDEYRTLFLKAKLIVDKATEISQDRASSVTDPSLTVTRKTLKLPAIELPKFSGNIKDWLSFWSVFRKIHEDPTIRKEDKFQYLVQATAPDSRAQDLVKSFPPTADNYDSVISSLKNRFGRDDMVVEFYVRELLGLVLQNAVKGSQKLSLASIHDKLESYIRALGSLGVTTDKCASMLYPLVESSLPEEVLRAWQRSGQRDDAQRVTKDRLARLLEFLQAEVENQERIGMALQGFGLAGETDKLKKTKGKTETNNVASASALLTTNKEKRIECIFCKESHESSECEHARKLSLFDRRQCVKEASVCFTCLKRGHMSKNCRSKVKCVWCTRRHYLILCPGISSKNEIELKNGEKGNEVENNLATFCQTPEVCMQTLRVKMYSDSGEKVVRVIIDSASQRSYIRADIAKELRYKPSGDVEITHSLFGGIKSKVKKHDMFLARMKSLDGSYACNFSVLSQDTICETVPCVRKESWVKELKNRDIILSNIGEGKSSVDVLIGADVAGKLLTGKKYDLNKGLIAFKTLLGCTFMGKMPGDNSDKANPVGLLTAMFAREADLTDLWRLDVLGINDPIEKIDKSVRNENVKDFIRRTTKINSDNRCEVQLPWRDDHTPLPDNLDLARRRLNVTVGKLKKEDYFTEYGDVFKSWLAEGIIEIVPEKELTLECHYLPHRPVIKLSGTTKIRPVFDASAYKKGYPSLNQCLEVGPNMIELVPDTLNRFREREIGVISDIKGALLQIAVDKKDRDFLRFLWVDNGKEIAYRHCRVVFGLSCSPFLLAATIESLLDAALIKAQQSDGSLWSEDSVRKLYHSLYVDNCVASLDSLIELHKFIYDATAIMASGGFDLRLWEHTGDSLENESALVLGVSWNKRKDSISINPSSIAMQIPQMVTKRTILSVAHKVFDPIGFTCPVTLQPKILLSRLWEEGADWDSSIDCKRKHEFVEWVKNLHLLKDIELSRKLPKGKLTIHAFGDASGMAYASVIFARVEGEGAIEVHLISARSRIAPKKTTIPRLELMAASITARLTNSVVKSLTRQIEGVFYWSDSTTVLSWLRRENGN